jgi:hypothetical protein
MKVPAFLLSVILTVSPLAHAGGEEAFVPAGNDERNEIIDRYLDATKVNKPSGIQMDAEVDAELPKLQKKGRLEALRMVSRLGKITWDHLHFTGDNTIKKEVIARFIQGEQDQNQTAEAAKAGITRENYKFKYKGSMTTSGQRVYIFNLTPRKKTPQLFKGELWVSADTYLPVHEAGTFTKSPSVFLKKVQFARDYEMVNGYSVPKHVESQAETRFWGPAQVSIHYNNIVKSGTDETSTVAMPDHE